MSEPEILADLRARASNALTMIRRVMLSASNLPGPHHRAAHLAVIELGEAANPEVVLALLDERVKLHARLDAAEAVIRGFIGSAGEEFTELKLTTAIALALAWLDDPVTIGREPIAHGKN